MRLGQSPMNQNFQTWLSCSGTLWKVVWYTGCMLQEMPQNGKRDDQQELYTTRHVVHLWAPDEGVK